MPRRIVLHAGFHKTGTSTVQDTLRANRVALKKQIALRLRWHLKDVLAAARGYSIDSDPLTLIKLQVRFGEMVNDLPGMPRRTLVISAEELSGHLPGQSGLPDYRAAPVLMYTYWEILHARYPDAEIYAYFTTRNPDDWLVSAYWEQVRSSDMTMPLEAFCARFAGAADLEAIVTETASRVPIPVINQRLEDCRDLLLGPTDPLLDLCDIPVALRPTLTPVSAANQRLDADVLAALLDANRTATSPEARAVAKKAIIDAAKNT